MTEGHAREALVSQLQVTSHNWVHYTTYCNEHATQAMFSNLVDLLTCTICQAFIRYPHGFVYSAVSNQWHDLTCDRLPCGHVFCQLCLDRWFGTTLAQHANAQAHPPDLQDYRNALHNPHLDPQMREHVVMVLQTYEEGLPRPQYTCPACRTAITTRPTKELCGISQVIDLLARQQMTLNGVGQVEERQRRGDDVWDRYFPRGLV